MKTEDAIRHLQELGYLVTPNDELSKKEKMIQNIMKTYDELSKEGKKMVKDYIMMMLFINENRYKYERFCFRHGVAP